MSERPAYTEFHPRWYRRPMPAWWWLRKRTYLVFILRELSSIFVAWGVVFLLLMIRAVGQGAVAYEEFLDWADHPFVVLLNMVALLFVVLHTITWFNLTPQAIVVRVGDRPVPAPWIVVSQYLGWLAVSAGLLWLLVGA